MASDLKYWWAASRFPITSTSSQVPDFSISFSETYRHLNLISWIPCKLCKGRYVRHANIPAFPVLSRCKVCHVYLRYQVLQTGTIISAESGLLLWYRMHKALPAWSYSVRLWTHTHRRSQYSWKLGRCWKVQRICCQLNIRFSVNKPDRGVISDHLILPR